MSRNLSLQQHTYYHKLRVKAYAGWYQLITQSQECFSRVIHTIRCQDPDYCGYCRAFRLVFRTRRHAALAEEVARLLAQARVGDRGEPRLLLVDTQVARGGQP